MFKIPITSTYPVCLKQPSNELKTPPAKCMSQLKLQDYPETPLHLCLWLSWLPGSKPACGRMWVFSLGEGSQCVHLKPGSASKTFPLLVPCPPVSQGLRDTTAPESTFLQRSACKCFPLCGAAQTLSPLCSGVSSSSLMLTPSLTFSTTKAIPLLRVQSKSEAQNILNLLFSCGWNGLHLCSLKVAETGMAQLECSRKETPGH